MALRGRREQTPHETLDDIDPVQALSDAGELSDEAYVTRLVADTVARFGRLDILVNIGPFEQTTTSDGRIMMSADLDSAFYGARTALPHLANSGGAMINLPRASDIRGDRSLSA